MAVVGTGRGRGDRGAAAVEFALVTPLLLVILFGIIDYGIWFADSIAARQAVRDAARQAVVEQFGSCGGGVTGDLPALACTVKSTMDQISGTTAVRISVVNSPVGTSLVAWAQGATLRICAMTQHQTLLPFVPFPNNGISYTRVDMPIESAVGTNLAARTTYTDQPPSGGDWLWCPP
jgi:Flp pilus assembly protein TadG